MARALGFTVKEIGYSKRGGSGWVRSSKPPGEATTRDELCVTLAGVVMDTRTGLLTYTAETASVAREVEIASIMRAAKRIVRTGFLPKTMTDKWKAALLLVSMQPTIGGESLDAIERDLREAWQRAAEILDAPRQLDVPLCGSGPLEPLPPFIDE